MKNVRLVDLVKVETLQRIQDAFSDMTGIAALTTDENGVPITVGSNFSDFCFNYTRKSEIGCSQCEKCDKYGAELALRSGRSITYTCHAGLVDFAAPIIVHGKLLGCFIGGQVLKEEPNEEMVRVLAQEIGVDPDEYVKAVRKVKIISTEQVDKAAEFLYTIASVISEITYSRYVAHRANEELEKATNMKSDFLANMSHEIRTPMNAVIGMAEMALREDLPENAREYINEIKSAGKSLLTIVNDILDFSKIESGKMDIVPVEYEPMSIINDVANIIVTRLEDKNVEFILDIDPTLPNKLLGDNDRIKQIILNITNNAIKFTRQGQVLLKVSFSKTSNEDIMLHVWVKDTGIGIKKADLPRLFQSFQQLDSKRNRNIEGTGLGLAICKQLLTLMGGDIRVESEYEKGSCFSIDLPQKVLDERASVFIKADAPIISAGIIKNEYVKKQLKASIIELGAEYIDLKDEEELDCIKKRGVLYLFLEPSELTEGIRWFIETNPQVTAILIIGPKEKIPEDVSGMQVVRKPIYSLNLAMIFNEEGLHYENSKTDVGFDFVPPEAEILIVDDNAINLTVAEGLLEPLKMKIDTALSGKEAIDKITNHRYDIIFMDHMMPELDGVETTHIIRRFHPEYDDIPIVALTANAVEGTMEMFLKEGMNDFIAKPIELRVLVARVRKWLKAEKIQKNVLWEERVASKESEKIPKIGDLDVKTALNLIGSEKLFWCVLQDYYRVIEQKAETIKKYEKDENYPAYTIEVHALKSASKQIGAHELSDKAAELERAGNIGDLEMIHAKTDDMLEQYKSYIPILKPFCSTDKKEKRRKRPITDGVLKNSFEKLRLAMDDLDMDAMEAVVEEMKQYEYEGEAKTLFGQLQDATANIDIECCEAIMQTWEARNLESKI